MKFAIAFSVFFVTTLAACVFLQEAHLALFLGGFSPVMVIYLVYKVLKDPNEPEETFDETFYQDHLYKRS